MPPMKGESYGEDERSSPSLELCEGLRKRVPLFSSRPNDPLTAPSHQTNRSTNPCGNPATLSSTYSGLTSPRFPGGYAASNM